MKKSYALLLKRIVKVFALAAVLYPLIATPSVTHAQDRGDLFIRSVQVIQVVKDPRLIVAGKPAALEVEVFNTFTEPVSVPIAVKYNFGNSAYIDLGPHGRGVPLNPGRNKAYLTGGPVSSDEAPWITGEPYLIWDTKGVDTAIEVVIDPDRTIEDDDPGNNSKIIEKEVMTPIPFKVLFAPVVFGADDDFPITRAAMERQRRFMLETYPLASLTFGRRSILRLADIPRFYSATAYNDYIFNLSAEAAILGYDRLAIVLNHYNYCGIAIQMLDSPADRVPVVLLRECIEDASMESITAHEIGHTFYLWHPHDPWFNLPVYSDFEYSVTERVYGSTLNTFMSYEPSPHWIDRYRYQDFPKTWLTTPPQWQYTYTVPGTYQWNLLDQFQAINPSQVILIKAKMYSDGALEMLPWYQMAGVPDLEQGSFTPVTNTSLAAANLQSTDTRRNLNLVMLNSSQQQVAVFPFMVTFTKLVHFDFADKGEWTAVDTDVAPFYFKVPFFDDIALVRIIDENGNVLGERTVSSNAPSVRVVDPNGGSYIVASVPYPICWSAEDKDGDPLKYSLSYSSNGGESWIPIISEIDDTCFQWDTSGLFDGSDYLVKVIATDGINTGEDISDSTFAIREGDCPDSNREPTIIIDGCTSGVANKLFNNGCTMNDLIAQCAESAKNHGKFVSCVADLTNGWKKDKMISGKEKGVIQTCAAEADIP